MAPTMPTDTASELSLDILAYLMENPQAQDTFEGIVEWWLLERQIRRATLQVRKALAELLREGLVVEVPGRDQRSHYRVNLERTADVRNLLNHLKDCR